MGLTLMMHCFSDRISHGEADPKTIQYEIIDRFLAIIIYFCCKYDIENKNQGTIMFTCSRSELTFLFRLFFYPTFEVQAGL